MSVLVHETGETYEEKQLRLRRATIRRIMILAVICVICLGARFFIKDPPPQKTADVSREQIRYVPGMLDALPADTLNKMDPALLARLQKAEQEAKRARIQQLVQSNTVAPYKPAEAPVPNEADVEAIKQLAYAYKKREKVSTQKKEETNVDLTKSYLVHFTRGGYIRAEKAEQTNNRCAILVDRTMLATVPNRIVKSVSADALTWKEPVPAGFVRLKPAKGITITVGASTAKRITVPKSIYDEI